MKSNLAFMSNFQITLESDAIKSSTNNVFVGNSPNYRITKKISCSKGLAKPVLDKPLTISDLAKLHS